MKSSVYVSSYELRKSTGGRNSPLKRSHSLSGNELMGFGGSREKLHGTTALNFQENGRPKWAFGFGREGDERKIKREGEGDACYQKRNLYESKIKGSFGLEDQREKPEGKNELARSSLQSFQVLNRDGFKSTAAMQNRSDQHKKNSILTPKSPSQQFFGPGLRALIQSEETPNNKKEKRHAQTPNHKSLSSFSLNYHSSSFGSCAKPNINEKHEKQEALKSLISQDFKGLSKGFSTEYNPSYRKQRFGSKSFYESQIRSHSGSVSGSRTPNQNFQSKPEEIFKNNKVQDQENLEKGIKFEEKRLLIEKLKLVEKVNEKIEQADLRKPVASRSEEMTQSIIKRVFGNRKPQEESLGRMKNFEPKSNEEELVMNKIEEVNDKEKMFRSVASTNETRIEEQASRIAYPKKNISHANIWEERNTFSPIFRSMVSDFFEKPILKPKTHEGYANPKINEAIRPQENETPNQNKTQTSEFRIPEHFLQQNHFQRTQNQDPPQFIHTTFAPNGNFFSSFNQINQKPETKRQVQSPKGPSIFKTQIPPEQKQGIIRLESGKNLMEIERNQRKKASKNAWLEDEVIANIMAKYGSEYKMGVSHSLRPSVGDSFEKGIETKSGFRSKEVQNETRENDEDEWEKNMDFAEKLRKMEEFEWQGAQERLVKENLNSYLELNMLEEFDEDLGRISEEDLIRIRKKYEEPGEESSQSGPVIESLYKGKGIVSSGRSNGFSEKDLRIEFGFGLESKQKREMKTQTRRGHESIKREPSLNKEKEPVEEEHQENIRTFEPPEENQKCFYPNDEEKSSNFCNFVSLESLKNESNGFTSKNQSNLFQKTSLKQKKDSKEEKISSNLIDDLIQRSVERGRKARETCSFGSEISKNK